MTDCAAETLTSEPPGALATIRTYDDLHQALRARAEALQVTRNGMDEVGGMPMGYCGKLLAPEQVKLIGRHSMGALLGVLGLKLLVVEDREALARYTSRVPKRKLDLNARGAMLAVERPANKGLAGNSDWGELMQKLWVMAIGPRRRQRIARAAAQARWAAASRARSRREGPPGGVRLGAWASTARGNARLCSVMRYEAVSVTRGPLLSCDTSALT